MLAAANAGARLLTGDLLALERAQVLRPALAAGLMVTINPASSLWFYAPQLIDGFAFTTVVPGRDARSGLGKSKGADGA